MTRAMGLLFLLFSTAASADAPRASLEKLAWLAGQWRGEGAPGRIDCFWLPPSGGSMAGVFRQVRGGQATGFALATVEEEGTSLILRWKIFDAGLRGRDPQEAPSLQRLLSIGPSEVRFERASLQRSQNDIELTVGQQRVRMSRRSPANLNVTSTPSEQEPVVQATPGAVPPPARIDAGAWLEGDWMGKGLGGTSEEAWLPPSGGNMAGVYRGMRDGQITFFEVMTLVETASSLAVRLKHFAPDLRGWEPAPRAVEFSLVRAGPGALFLDGMTYRRTADGLESWVIIGLRDGGIRPEKFLYDRRAP